MEPLQDLSEIFNRLSDMPLTRQLFIDGNLVEDDGSARELLLLHLIVARSALTLGGNLKAAEEADVDLPLSICLRRDSDDEVTAATAEYVKDVQIATRVAASAFTEGLEKKANAPIEVQIQFLDSLVDRILSDLMGTEHKQP